jgi:hypothetical protein
LAHVSRTVSCDAYRTNVSSGKNHVLVTTTHNNAQQRTTTTQKEKKRKSHLINVLTKPTLPQILPTA